MATIHLERDRSKIQKLSLFGFLGSGKELVSYSKMQEKKGTPKKHMNYTKRSKQGGDAS
jgi:hypothetical protein